jgi:hypothetical protein
MTLHAPYEDAIRDPSGLWGWMRFLVLVTIISYIAVLAGGVATWAVLTGEISVTPEQATIIDMTFGVGAIASIALYLLSAFATGRVTYRLMKNAHELRSDEELTSPGWAVGWYFIPFANFVMPVRAVGQIWRTTFRHLGQDKGGAVIGWWWAAWIISSIVLTVSDRLGGGAEAEADETTYAIIVVGYGLRLICAALLLVVFGTLVKAQKNLNTNVADAFS